LHIDLVGIHKISYYIQASLIQEIFSDKLTLRKPFTRSETTGVIFIKFLGL